METAGPNIGSDVLETGDNLDSAIENYRQMKLGFRRVVDLSIRQVVPEMGDAEQSLRLELLGEANSKNIVLEFLGLRQLQLADLHPGSLCCLEISPIASSQMEGLNYRVSNLEQDLTLSFYCRKFEVR
jgi:hypothetical protein